MSLRALAANYAVDEPGKLVLQWLDDGSVVMVDGGAVVSRDALAALAGSLLKELATTARRLTFSAALPDILAVVGKDEQRNISKNGFTPFSDMSQPALVALYHSNKKGMRFCLLLAVADALLRAAAQISSTMAHRFDSTLLRSMSTRWTGSCDCWRSPFTF